MRVETVLSVLTRSDEKPGEEEFQEEFTEDKLHQCAATIAVAYLNPRKQFSVGLKVTFIGDPVAVEWDINRFSWSTKVRVE